LSQGDSNFYGNRCTSYQCQCHWHHRKTWSDPSN